MYPPPSSSSITHKTLSSLHRQFLLPHHFVLLRPSLLPKKNLTNIIFLSSTIGFFLPFLAESLPLRRTPTMSAAVSAQPSSWVCSLCSFLFCDVRYIFEWEIDLSFRIGVKRKRKLQLSCCESILELKFSIYLFDCWIIVELYFWKFVLLFFGTVHLVLG